MAGSLLKSTGITACSFKRWHLRRSDLRRIAAKICDSLVTNSSLSLSKAEKVFQITLHTFSVYLSKHKMFYFARYILGIIVRINFSLFQNLHLRILHHQRKEKKTNSENLIHLRQHHLYIRPTVVALIHVTPTRHVEIPVRIITATCSKQLLPRLLHPHQRRPQLHLPVAHGTESPLA